jgi:hypothetical protein
MANPVSTSTLDNNLTTGGTNAQGLAEWASPYITNYLGQAQALANTPYQAYQGPLTAGTSALQTQGFQGLAGLTVPSSIGQAATTAGNVATNLSGMSYAPTTFGNQFQAPDAYKSVGSGFDAGQAQQYMNPYLQASLNPQIEEARRQSQITQMQNAGKMANAGAFGGSRQALMDTETQRNLGTNLANITGQGYNTAFNNAQQQFNADQQRKIQEAQFGSQQGMTAAQLAAQYGLSGQQATEQSKQFGSNFGLNAQNAALGAAQAQGQLGNMSNQANLANLNAQLAGGAVQRGIESEGTAADLAEFEKQRQYPYQQVQFQRDMISGLPVASVSNTPGSLTGMGALLSSLGGATSVASALGYKDVGSLLKKLGLDLGP